MEDQIILYDVSVWWGVEILLWPFSQRDFIWFWLEIDFDLKQEPEALM